MTKKFDLQETLNNASVFNDRGQIFSSSDSFVRGYNFGRARRRELTSREIEASFPDVEVQSFTNGMLDGIRGDRFRLDLTLKQLKA